MPESAILKSGRRAARTRARTRATRKPRLLAILLLALYVTAPGCSGASSEDKEKTVTADTKNIVVVISTNKGPIEVELDAGAAPATVANFLKYADEGFYDNTIFHRVIPAFMIQGGGFDSDYGRKETHAPIKNEADNGLRNLSGTIAMARTSVVDSATSQFFLNVKDNPFLDHKAPTPSGHGYAVFGKIVSGMDVMRAIEKTPTSSRGAAFTNAPVDAVIIESVKRK